MIYWQAYSIAFMLSFGLCSAQNESEKKEQKNTFHVTESAHLAEVLEVVKDKDIQTPEIKPPSAFMVWVRSFGIALAYKFYAVREWLIKKFRKTPEDLRS